MPALAEIVDRYGKQKYLAFSLFFYLIADAFVPDSRLLNFALLALLIITGPLATARNRKEQSITVALALMMVSLGVASSYFEPLGVYVAANITGAAFFLALIVLISRSLLVEATRVTAETLWAAINVYVLIGVFFSFLYTLLVAVEPGAFSGGLLVGDREDVSQSLLYYSFVTMTTLGYGDILPNIHVAATLAYVQALVGQLYVAILIARLVSRYTIGEEES
jgi:hypothetical protein